MATTPTKRSVSAVWDYFTVVHGLEEVATCNICNTVIRRGSAGASSKSFSTKSLWGHLKAKHKDEHCLAEEKQAEELQKKEKKRKIQEDRAQVYGLLEKASSSSTLQQLTLLGTMDGGKPWDSRHPEQIKDFQAKVSKLKTSLEREIKTIRNTPSGSGGGIQPKWELSDAPACTLPLSIEHITVTPSFMIPSSAGAQENQVTEEPEAVATINKNPDDRTITSSDNGCEVVFPTPSMSFGSVSSGSASSCSSSSPTRQRKRKFRSRSVADQHDNEIMDTLQSMLSKYSKPATLAQNVGTMVTGYLSLLPQHKQKDLAAKIVSVIQSEPISPEDLQ